MSDLFPEIQDDLSPLERARRAFSAEYGVNVRHTPEEATKPWHAYRGAFKPDFLTLKAPTRHHARAQTEAAAIEELAVAMGVELRGGQA